MSKVTTGLIGISSAAITFVVAFANHAGLENFPGIVRLVAIVLSALAIGLIQGFFVQRARHRTIAIGAFFGLLILWSPVIVMTYGFALMGLPFLAAFAILVFFGAKAGANLRLKSCWSV
ncbi:hypothetical protein H3H37_18755 [Duganella sp. LX20W]|uniref:Uncharacterized protein n=1 Tax=Rugamonas brunnea TaxID=2758569 RepID=A0A7W2ID78_9BURK|nr:hypothetical protein [Rugamonas brunnea]MBA5639104.1 hypothetical protein [Rugamonas brunnea]